MKKISISLILLSAVVSAQVPAGYYDGTAGLSGYSLKSKLHEILSRPSYSYNYAELPGLYGTTDRDLYFENNGTLLDIYSEKPNGPDAYEYLPAQLIGSSSAEGNGYNREHGMPQSTFYGIYPMYSDLHYVIPADAYINQRRSNYPYAKSSGSSYIFSNGSKLGTSQTPGYSNSVFEPIDEFKGDVARFLLYFVTRYEGSLDTFNHQLSTSPLDGNEEKGYDDWYLALLKSWSAMDPVSQREIDRNNAVYNLQKVRNPFVDHPEWVNLIWSEVPDAVAPGAPSSLAATAVGESFISLNWQPSTAPDVLGYKIYVNGLLYGQTKSTSFVVDRLTAAAPVQISVKAYDKGYLLSADSNVLTVSPAAADVLARDLMITKYIEGTTSTTGNVYNNAIEITNKTGHKVNLNNYYLSMQLKNYSSGTYYFADAYKLEGEILPGESKVVINPFAALPSYSINQADFITSAPPLTFSGSQYIELSYGTKYLKTASTNNYGIAFTTVDAVGYKDAANSLSNVSLYRNSTVTDPNTAYTPSEWTVFPANYSDGLGQDAVLGTAEGISLKMPVIYPNPVTDGVLFVSGENISAVRSAAVLDMSGKMLKKVVAPFKNGNSLNVSGIIPGKYYLVLDGKAMPFFIR